MSISSTVLVFVVIPVGIVVLMAALVLASGDRSRRDRRYRPGRPYDFQPIWFLASPERVSVGGGNDAHHAHAIEAPVFEDSSGHRVTPGPVGGASDNW